MAPRRPATWPILLCWASLITAAPAENYDWRYGARLRSLYTETSRPDLLRQELLWTRTLGEASAEAYAQVALDPVRSEAWARSVIERQDALPIEQVLAAAILADQGSGEFPRETTLQWMEANGVPSPRDWRTLQLAGSIDFLLARELPYLREASPELTSALVPTLGEPMSPELFSLVSEQLSQEVSLFAGGGQSNNLGLLLDAYCGQADEPGPLRALWRCHGRIGKLVTMRPMMYVRQRPEFTRFALEMIDEEIQAREAGQDSLPVDMIAEYFREHGTDEQVQRYLARRMHSGNPGRLYLCMDTVFQVLSHNPGGSQDIERQRAELLLELEQRQRVALEAAREALAAYPRAVSPEEDAESLP